jgi:hypothetical protein
MRKLKIATLALLTFIGVSGALVGQSFAEGGYDRGFSGYHYGGYERGHAAAYDRGYSYRGDSYRGGRDDRWGHRWQPVHHWRWDYGRHW